MRIGPLLAGGRCYNRWSPSDAEKRGLALDERLERPAAARVAQLAQRLGFDLADALARDVEVLADLFERMVGALPDAEAHLDDALLARREGRETAARLA